MTMESPDSSAPRPYQPADRAAAAALLGDARALDQPGTHAHVTDDADAIALWLEPPTGGSDAYLGPVLGRTPGPDFYQLVLACALDMLERGYTHGYFEIRDAALLRIIERTFRVEPVPLGFQPQTTPGDARVASSWRITVDLLDATNQLRAVLPA